MTLWFIDRLFENEEDAEAREAALERIRQQRKRERALKREQANRELDKVRDPKGALAPGAKENDASLGSSPVGTKKEAGTYTLVGSALDLGFGLGAATMPGNGGSRAALPPGSSCPGILQKDETRREEPRSPIKRPI